MSKTQRGRRRRIAAVALILLVIGALLLAGRRKEPPAFQNVPHPNAYELLVNAASKLQGKQPNYIKTELPDYVAQNQESLQLMRNALTNSAEMPLPSYQSMIALMGELRSFQSLAGAARLQAELHENNGKWQESAAVHLDLVRMAHATMRGPFIALTMAVPIESSGLAGLNRAATNLTASAARQIAQELARIESSRMRLADVRSREERLMTLTLGSRFLVRAFYPLLPQFRRSLAKAEADLANSSLGLNACKDRLLAHARSLESMEQAR